MHRVYIYVFDKIYLAVHKNELVRLLFSLYIFRAKTTDVGYMTLTLFTHVLCTYRWMYQGETLTEKLNLPMGQYLHRNSNYRNCNNFHTYSNRRIDNNRHHNSHQPHSNRNYNPNHNPWSNLSIKTLPNTIFENSSNRVLWVPITYRRQFRNTWLQASRYISEVNYGHLHRYVRVMLVYSTKWLTEQQLN